jgi:glucuronoarabinoxylan endo-1,4-beta-xylanase
MRTPIGSLLWVLAAAIISLPASANINILVNPGFESGDTTGCTARSASISAVTGGRTGTYRAYATGRTAAWQGIKQSILGKLSHGQTCTISGWVRLDNAASDAVKLTVEQRDDSPNTKYIPIKSATGSNTQWTHLSGQFTLNVTGTLTRLDIYFEGPAAGVSFYVDDAEVLIPETTGAASASVNPAIRRQTIEGFGAAGAWYDNWLLAHPKRTELYTILFKDLGLDIYRLRNTFDQGTSGADYMDRAVQIVAGAETALQRPLKILISSWSPPAYLKSTDQLRRGTLKTSNGGFMYAEFARWWADSVQAWAARGIHPDYISIQNEPDWEADWDTCRFNPAQTSTIAGYDTAFDAVYDELHARMGQSMPKMLAPESTGFSGAAGYSLHQYLTALNDPSKVYGYAHHLYNINAGDNPDNYLAAMAAFNAHWGHKPLFQTEYEKATGAWPDALNMALLLHNSLTVEQVAAYLYWDLFWENGGLVSLDDPWQSNPGYTLNSDYYGFKHFSAFIHSGWQRIDAASDTAPLRLSAYISPDNLQLTVVIINPSAETAFDLTLTLPGFALENASLFRTTQTQNCIPLGPFNPAVPLTLPPASITTLAALGRLIPVDCAHVHSLGRTLPGDLNADCVVNLLDLLTLADRWLIDAAAPLALDAFAPLSADWLACNDPQNPDCTKNW